MRILYIIRFFVEKLVNSIGKIIKLTVRDFLRNCELYLWDIDSEAVKEAEYRMRWGWNETFVSRYRGIAIHRYPVLKIEDRAEDWFDKARIESENKKTKQNKIKAMGSMEEWAKSIKWNRIKPDIEMDFSKLRQEVKNF